MPPSHNTYDLYFKYKIIVSKQKNEIKSRRNLPDHNTTNDNINLEYQLLKSAEYIKIPRA